MIAAQGLVRPDDVEARFRVTDVLLLGHSNGGFMAYRLACEIPERITALASLAGAGLADPGDCRVSDVPVDVLQVHGLNDDTMPLMALSRSFFCSTGVT